MKSPLLLTGRTTGMGAETEAEGSGRGQITKGLRSWVIPFGFRHELGGESLKRSKPESNMMRFA